MILYSFGLLTYDFSYLLITDHHSILQCVIVEGVKHITAEVYFPRCSSLELRPPYRVENWIFQALFGAESQRGVE